MHIAHLSVIISHFIQMIQLVLSVSLQCEMPIEKCEMSVPSA